MLARIFVWAAACTMLSTAAVFCEDGALPTGVDDEAKYPRSGLLIEPTEIGDRLADSRVLVLDAREKSKFEAENIPGSVWVDHAEWAKEFKQGNDSAGWSKRIGSLGISQGLTVVVYDDVLSRDAARIWWILRYWGAKDVRLLNGGWKGWLASGEPKKINARPQASPQIFHATPVPARVSWKSELKQTVKDSARQIVDARSVGEYCGDNIFNNKRAGAVPGAKNLEWTDLIDKETHRFKPANEMARLFTAAGIDPSKPSTTYCQSGGRASVMAFALELMGARDVKTYYNSWSEWGNASDTPVFKPARPRTKNSAKSNGP